MTRLARVDMYAVAPLLPGDKVAGRVAARGEHFEWSPPERQIHSSEPLALRAPSPAERSVFSFVDLTGIKAGRLTVLGIAADLYLSSGQRWVVRCVCGAYEVRRAKYLKSCAAGEKTGDDEPMCSACSYTRKLQRGFHNPKKAAAAAQTIQNSIR
ncbi:hypothetical protein A6U87_14965 [Rhizobium sp. AC44/96]|uniref:hypothetical protein n=1 Tax=Rhizobium sp. AC44/96 TaxID=1841654 RepID=UPI00080F8929|nr:hypothetical protein [Rhizobium sp. AC44/96]OCJ05302.1 hypothetical protein A6U87_14965 [Rhizobium sp. AC44/96]